MPNRSLVTPSIQYRQPSAQRATQIKSILRGSTASISAPPSVISSRPAVKIEKKDRTQTSIPDLPIDDSFGKANIKVM